MCCGLDHTNNTDEKASNLTVIVSYEDMHNNTGCCNSLKVEQIWV